MQMESVLILKHCLNNLSWLLVFLCENFGTVSERWSKTFDALLPTDSYFSIGACCKLYVIEILQNKVIKMRSF